MSINTIVSTLNNKIQKSYINYVSLFLLIFILFPVSSIGQNLLKNVDLNKYPIKLVGTLNGKRITLYVSQNNKSIEGLYYYGKYTEYLTLEGQIDDRNQIYLNE
jgi:predicted AAA+ superfamily ATPase